MITDQNENRLFSIPKKYIYFGLTAGLFVLLIWRLFYLQIYATQKYYLQSQKNHIREVTREPLRGLIYDREGRVLVENHPAYSVYITPYELSHTPHLLDRLSKILELSPSQIKANMKRRQNGRFKPVRLKRQVSFKEISLLEENKLSLPGVGLWVEPKRFYPSSAHATHVLGYIGEISTGELKKLAKKGYKRGDIIGKRGLEAEYDQELRGKEGLEYVEVDAQGRQVRKLKSEKSIPPVPGKNLILGLDIDLQSLAEDRLKGKRGSVVLLDARDGSVLALASMPDYDLKEFSGVITNKIWEKYFLNPENPMYNRAVQSSYPPGSTYKPITAVAGLDSKIITEHFSVTCRGYLRLGRRNYYCWYRKGHGTLDLIHGIENSCNVYFYTLGAKIGVDVWADYSRRFHFGEKTGIDLPSENAGLVPDRNYLDKKFGKDKWSKGLMLNMAIGQGDLLVTPLQMAQLAMILANDGLGYRPHLVIGIQDPFTLKVTSVKIDSFRVNADPRNIQIVREGMRLVVNGPTGTGRRARLPDIVVAGKTGTTQNPHGKDHAWFIGFAPFDHPEVAIAVMIENGGYGGHVAAPIAHDLFQLYFQKHPIQPTVSGKVAMNPKRTVHNP
ncbi:MAG: penicillin-binding protein 2 [Calditrichaeota bacterium]|nr:penicillin-binding protein 2 [Calditrichota bacterium]